MEHEQSAAVQLPVTFDVPRLRADLEEVGYDAFRGQRTYNTGTVIESAVVGWRVLALRSPGGDPDRTDPGGPGLVEYADTPWRARTPYLASILDTLPTRLRTARLMVLAPGAEVDEHRDYPYGLGAGWVRLHVPILTNDRAASIIDGLRQQWQPGTFWYGDFDRPHSVHNHGSTDRVHLVVDCYVNHALLDLFPVEFRTAVRWTDVLVQPDEVPLSDADAMPERVLQVPAAFLRGVGPDDLAAETEPDLTAGLHRDGGRLLLDIDGLDPARLVHLGGGTFRLAGWTTERTVHLHTSGSQVVARYQVRFGSRVEERTRRTVPALV